jgi:DNA (cytosine-5)-methyltransferase 3A
MNVVSYFDGGSCGQIALDRLGVKVDNYFAYEIKPHAIKLTQTNYPNTIQMGSVVGADLSKLPKTDLLIGGSPCQSFSIAGSRTGFNGKSGLFWEFVKAKETLKPKYFFLENVKMKKEWEQVITNALGVEPVFINSKIFTAQNRPRLYWTNIPFDNDILDKNIYLKDIVNLETKRPLKDGIDRIKIVEKVNVRKYDVDIESLKTLLKSSKNKTIREIASILKVKKTTVDHWFRGDKCFSIPEPDIWFDLKKCLSITETKFDEPICTFIEKDNVFDMSNRVYRINGKAPTLTASNKKVRVMDDESNVFLLNSTHFEKLQTMPIGYTNCLTENQAMNIIGDGWTVEVVEYFFKGMSKNP